MTDADIAAAYESAKRLEEPSRACVDEARIDDHAEREAATAVLRQAVALRRALGNWIVTRATSAQGTAVAR